MTHHQTVVLHDYALGCGIALVSMAVLALVAWVRKPRRRSR